MLITSHDIDHADWRPIIEARKDMKKVTQPPTQISPQTTWMLAVRDRRDRAAFSALFDHFAPRLKGFVMRSGTGSAQAEEIVQDVMLTVWRKAEQFDPARAQVSAWIYKIARNRQIDVIRKEGRPLPDELGEDQSTEPDASLNSELRSLKCVRTSRIGNKFEEGLAVIEFTNACTFFASNSASE